MTAVLTLTTHNTNYRLDKILSGAVGSTNNSMPDLAAQSARINCKQLTIVGDPGNGAGIVGITDGLASPVVTQGIQLSAGAGFTWGTTSGDDSVSLADKYLVGSADGVLADVTIVW